MVKPSRSRSTRVLGGYSMPAVPGSPTIPRGKPYPTRTGDSDIELTVRLFAW